MSKHADRVRETSTSTGTGTINLAGAYDGRFVTFVAGIGTGKACLYTIEHNTPGEWEVGFGVVTDASPDTLSRLQVFASSNAGSLVNFSAGLKHVYAGWGAKQSQLTQFFHEPCRVAVTTDVTLATALVNGASAGGVTLATGDRVLLTGQSTASQNGIQVVAASGAPARPVDFYTGDSARGALVAILAGDSAGTMYACTSAAGSDVVGTHSLAWTQLGGSAIADGSLTNAKLANMAQSTIKGRAASSGTGAPVDLTATQATAILNAMVGDTGSGGTKGLVPAPAAGDAAAGKFLKADGTWTAPTGSGDVVGPSSATDNAIARFDSTTGKLIQNSGVTIDDSDKISAKASFCPLYSNSDGATITFDMAASNQHKVTLGGSRTLAVSNVSVGQTFSVRLAQDPTGGRTATWWSGITWMTNGGAAPTLKAAADAVDCFVFRCTGTGTYDGWHVSGQVRELQVASVQTASFTAVAGNLYPVDLSGASADLTMTLPASPADGDTISTIITATHASYKLLVGRNGKTLQKGTNANPYKTWQVGERIAWRYVDGGWLVVEDAKIPIAARIERQTARTIPNATWTAVQCATSALNRGGVVNTGSYRIDIPRDCSALVSAYINVDATSNTIQHTVICRVCKNTSDETGLVLSSLENQAAAGAGYLNLPTAKIPPTLLSLAAGDYLTLHVFQANGSTASRDTYAAATYYPYLQVLEVPTP